MDHKGKKHKKKGRKANKIGRNLVKCAKYRREGRREINKERRARRIEKRLRRHNTGRATGKPSPVRSRTPDGNTGPPERTMGSGARAFSTSTGSGRDRATNSGSCARSFFCLV